MVNERITARTSCIAGVTLALVLVLAAERTHALEDLEAEESISDFMPSVYPTTGRGKVAQSRNWAILPELGYAPDTGALAGAKFAHRDLLQSGATLDFEATYAMNQQRSVSLSLGSPHLLEDRLLILLRGKYYFDPQRQFFGLGNNDLSQDPDLPSTHEFQELAGGVVVGWRPFDQLAFNLAVGLRRVDIGRSKRKDGLPLTQEKFADMTGINGGLTNRLALSLVWNNRDDVMRPTRGWRVILKVEHTNKAALSDFEFTRYVVDAGYLRSFFDKRLIAGIRANGAYIDGPDNEVPFWELEELGGQDSMRGFFPHRFLGKQRVLLNGELRCLLTQFDFFDLWHVKLDGVVFGDGGRVFLNHTDVREEFRIDRSIFDRVLGDFQYSYGGGLRIALSNALVARIDVGFSDEETGLVYLSFGQTF
jgi:outer membrane protein assembly factor BamA